MALTTVVALGNAPRPVEEAYSPARSMGWFVGPGTNSASARQHQQLI